MLGGMIIPRGEEQQVTAAAKGRLYLFLTMEGISTEPTAAESAVAAPEIPPKIMLTKILTAARPPGINPITAFEKLTSRVVNPAAFHDGSRKHE